MLDVTASYGMLFDSIVFFGYFRTLSTTIHVWIVLYPPNFHKSWCLFNIYTFWNANMLNVTISYGGFSNIIAFLGQSYILLHVWDVITWSNFYNLCVKAEMYRLKINLCPESFLKSQFSNILEFRHKLFNFYW